MGAEFGAQPLPALGGHEIHGRASRTTLRQRGSYARQFLTVRQITVAVKVVAIRRVGRHTRVDIRKRPRDGTEAPPRGRVMTLESTHTMGVQGR
ncbi:hypothetical protein GCM10022206_54700 [Streptomyces chiangmaiensis]